MRKIYFTVVALLFTYSLQAQTYSLTDLESSFLTNNYVLIAQKFNIQRADAEIIQERVWNNPTFSLNEVNLWHNAGSETLPNLFGKYGKHQQLSMEIEQLIETAGKRKKRVAIRQLEKNAEVLDYEDLMRELKKELRQTYNSLAQQQKAASQLQTIYESFKRLHEQYERQSKSNNIAYAEVYRVQAELMALQKEVVDIDTEKKNLLRTLIALTQIADLSDEQIVFPEFTNALSAKLPAEMLAIGLTEHAGIKKQRNELAIAEQELALEKSNSKPDFTLQLGYDRGGNIMQDFIGAGISFDIPVFNRNKGKIKAAGYQIEQESYKLKAAGFDFQQTALGLKDQLFAYEKTLKQWDDFRVDDYKLIVDNYRKNLQERRVSLIEYVDFMKSFRESQQLYVALVADYLNTYEELQYIVGKDF